MLKRYAQRVPFAFIAQQVACITCGSLLTAVGMNLFLIPMNLVKGGISGLSLLTSYLFPLPAWMWIALFNLPLFLLGLRKLGRGFLLGSLYGMLMMSCFMYLTRGLAAFHLLHNPIMASIFGGVTSGIGVGIAMRVNGSLGGTDIIGAIVQKHLSVGLGTIGFAANAVIVIITASLLGAEIASYALLAIFVEAMALDKTMRGIDTSKAIFIMTTKPDEIADKILTKLGRGVTYFQGEGAFRATQCKVLYCVVSLRQLARVKYYTQETDPKAFMSIADVSEVVGKGFRQKPF